ncbi:potassium-transporting ATPase KdpC subunit [Paenibacillus sp. CCS19]|uniref:potassium-transporting ATPase subunit KdpC n=1 Tax=Paenibacillus sp. CCS19 TaxID=3158387 RepID=UPI0025612C8A|nr:potassium-transporting ATPase subunit KdpC [Paenibacillus cellulosilyticus]GMK37316.1 potassium-transporting ATPase KdpC subunit [Paenibacillus cellulosilyticus]
MMNNAITAIRASVVFILLCGIGYPLLCTGLAQLFMPHQANGSLVLNAEGKVTGSALIGQHYDDPSYFQGRVSSIDYNGAGSGSNNYGPSNPEMLRRTTDSIEAWKKANPDVPISELPIALVTNSGSGLDPHITPASAEVQIPRISKLTGISQEQLHDLVKQYTEGRDLGIFGEPRVHVLELNLALKQLLTK